MASDLRQPDRAVAFVIAHRINHERPAAGCYIGLKRLSNDTGFSERAVRASLRRLEGCGIVVTEERFGRSSIFTINLARLVERARPEPVRQFRGPSKPKAGDHLTPARGAALKSDLTPAPQVLTPARGAALKSDLTPARGAPTPAPQVLTPARGAAPPARGAPVTGSGTGLNRLLNPAPTRAEPTRETSAVAIERRGAGNARKGKNRKPIPRADDADALARYGADLGIPAKPGEEAMDYRNRLFVALKKSGAIPHDPPR